MDIGQLLYGISIWLLPVLIAITFHEAAHGFVALRFGDDTALRLGRLTFNPLKHIDPFGSILLPAMLLLPHILWKAPIILFGYAKPVPVIYRRLNNPRRDMVWVAAAGPATNLLLALISALLLHLTPVLPELAQNWAAHNLENSIIVNVIIAVLNMLPLPPLDGGRVAVGLLPDVLAYPLARLERWGIFIILGVFLIIPLIGSEFGFDLNIFSWLLGGPIGYLVELITWIAGLT